MNTSRSSRGSALIVSLIIVIVALLAGGGYYFFVMKKDSTPQNEIKTVTQKPKNNEKLTQPIIEIKNILGSVSVTQGKGVTHTLTGNTSIALPLILKSGSGSEATIIFSDKSVLRLSSNTIVSLTEKKSGNISASISIGRIWARILGTAGGKSYLSIDTGDTKSIVRGTAFELEKLPLFTKYTVLDSGATGSEIPGIDVLDLSGALYHVLPEQTLTSDITHTVSTGSVNIGQLFQSNAFALRNTQEDILHMEDILDDSGDDADVDEERVYREILASLPQNGSEEFAMFVSGSLTSGLNLSTGSGNDWEKVVTQALGAQSESYEAYMNQYEVYMNRVIGDQQKLLESIMKDQQVFMQNNEEFIKKILKDQQTMLGGLMMQTNNDMSKLQEEMNSLFAEQEIMMNNILKDALNGADIGSGGMKFNFDMNQIMNSAMQEAMSDDDFAVDSENEDTETGSEMEQSMDDNTGSGEEDMNMDDTGSGEATGSGEEEETF